MVDDSISITEELLAAADGGVFSHADPGAHLGGRDAWVARLEAAHH